MRTNPTIKKLRFQLILNLIVRIRSVFIVAPLLFSVSCGFNSSKREYLLAERLWMDKQYKAAVLEFEKVADKEPHSRLGQVALFRAARTQTLFLEEHKEAIEKLRLFVKLSSELDLVWTAQLEIGEIFFSKLRDYPTAIEHYDSLLKMNPKPEDSARFQFRKGKSLFYLGKFDEALKIYDEIIASFPGSSWSEKASYERGVTLFTSGEQRPDEKTNMAVYDKAIQAFQGFLAQYPKSRMAVEAEFGIASCLEEMDQLDAAYKKYEQIQEQYPSPKVITIKLTRIKQRLLQKR